MKQKRAIPRPNTGGNLLPGTGRGGIHKNRKHPSGKQLHKALAAKQNKGIA
jgi:hypothetical protein